MYWYLQVTVLFFFWEGCGCLWVEGEGPRTDVCTRQYVPLCSGIDSGQWGWVAWAQEELEYTGPRGVGEGPPSTWLWESHHLHWDIFW